MAIQYHRYVAIGDSSTEGLDDPDGMGGYRGWADRLAARIAEQQGSLLYANLGVRGLHTRQIRERQLEPALAMRPDLSTLFTGTNDVVSRRFDPTLVESDLAFMQRALISQGATVVSFTLPDLAGVIPFGRWLTPRVHLLNEAIRRRAVTLVPCWWISPRIPSHQTSVSGATIASTPTRWVTP
jgi:lysophospholipase L1-like esterase